MLLIGVSPQFTNQPFQRMAFLFLKILLIFLGAVIQEIVSMEPSSDQFPKIGDLKMSIKFNQTSIPFPQNMTECVFESLELIDVICEDPDWTKHIAVSYTHLTLPTTPYV